MASALHQHDTRYTIIMQFAGCDAMVALAKTIQILHPRSFSGRVRSRQQELLHKTKQVQYRRHHRSAGLQQFRLHSCTV